MRRRKELPTVTVRHVRDVTYCQLEVDCPDKIYAELVRFGRKKILWDRQAMFEYGFNKALEAGMKK